ncbi:hypothetical protein GKG82_08300 [Salmonella enterica]|uniref:Uncharacterized protein n=1 Tax=Salmonella dublin TaxID=98360 RepID=A0A732GUW7_SALDU|nr:hypothetical protein [Salmonella enterica subsp. enterica serovar Singapore]EAA4014769.1 hypothetical protein [Salmonella enterica subsp. enterica serovar Newport]EAA9297656.1 hypothetical protein [Salmonella enterica subsp. enterica serovar Enteritidis]EAB4413719.1 hypothetical protein [Salmonella enterica]EBM9900056.1 hypothetical protein [Salmonella enterica subsp. enterica serovar Typhimurium]EBU9317791.1 hypothetical protein [Salmonella enterica subsp. enterica serovar Amager]EBV57637
MNKAEQQKRIKKIMLYAANEAVKVGVILLMFKYLRMTSEGYAQITVCDKPTIINWVYNGHNEFRVSVWWDYQPEYIPKLIKGRPENLKLLLPDVDRTRFRFIVGACVSFYFDYLHKGILSDKGKDFFAIYVRESSVNYIDKLEDVKPFGYTVSELPRPLYRMKVSATQNSKRN